MAISAMTLPQELIGKVLAGYPLLRYQELGESSLLSAPGRPLALVNHRGELLASGIADPENELFRIVTWNADEAPDDRLLLRRVRSALDLRLRLGLIPESRRIDGAFRLLNGEGDGVPGFLADAAGPFVVQYTLARGLREWGRRLAAAVVEASRELDLRTAEGGAWPAGILQKLRGKDSARPGKPVQWVEHGDEPPEKLLVREGSFTFEIHPLAGLNIGLFTDMREHRARVGRFSRGVGVLNTFAYTGTLSAGAALGGASRVTSVDLSSGVLKWAQENFRLAGLDPGLHLFETADVLKFLRQARASGSKYGLVILDPPTYSAARAASWSLKNHLPELLDLSLAILDGGGILWLSINSHQMSGDEVDQEVHALAIRSRRRLVLLETGGLPPDYPTPAAFQEGRYLKLRILRAS